MGKPNVKKPVREMAENPDVVIVKTATAPKLSPRGEGGIIYQVGRVGEDVYIRIEKNEGGGSHSKEFVPATAIKAAVTPAMKRGEPFRSDAFIGAFVGRSQCNSGFLVASLRAEGLLTVDGEHRGMSVLTGDLFSWELQMRTASPLLENGRPVTVKLHPEPKETPPPRPKRVKEEETPDGEVPEDGDDTGEESPEESPDTPPQKGRRGRAPKTEPVQTSEENPSET